MSFFIRKGSKKNSGERIELPSKLSERVVGSKARFNKKNNSSNNNAVNSSSRKRTTTRGRAPPAKQKKRDEEEEITSDEDEEGDEEEEEEEEVDREDKESETEQEARLRLAREQIQLLKEKAIIARRNNAEDDDDEEEVDVVAGLLKEQVMQEQGRILKCVVPDSYLDQSTHITGSLIARNGKALKSPVTSMCVSNRSGVVYVSTKNAVLCSFKRSEDDDESWKRIVLVTLPQKYRPITSISCSDNLVAACTPNCIVLLDPESLQIVQTLQNSRAPVSVVMNSEYIYSTHKDRTVKVWDAKEKAYVESLFGHQDVPMDVDIVTANERRILTAGGFDKSLRVWRIEQESQLVYNWSDEDVIDVVKVLNAGYFVAGGVSGTLGLFSFGRKKPLHLVPRAHGCQQQQQLDHLASGRWITALGGAGDLVVSGSDDGVVKVWRVCYRKLEFIRDLDLGDPSGVVVSIKVVDKPFNIFVAVSTEMRLGRWSSDKSRKSNKIIVF